MIQIIEILARVNIKLLKYLSPLYKRKGLSSTDFIVLWKVKKKGVYRATDIAKEMGITPSTITGILDRLEKKGLLLRIHDSKDRRSVLVKEGPSLDNFICETIVEANKVVNELFMDFDISNLLNDLENLDKFLEMKEGEVQDGKRN